MRAISHPRHPRGSAIRRPVLVAASFVLVSLVVAAYVADPTGRGPSLMRAAALPLAVVIGLGPLLRGARPRAVWALLPVGMAFLVIAVLIGPNRAMLGALYVTDLVNILGYLGLSVFVGCLGRLIMREGVMNVLLDALAATSGMFLALWTIIGLVDLQSNDSSLAWALYPVLDAFVLVLVIHVASRIRRTATAWRWVVGAVILQFTLDVGYFVTGVASRAWPPAAYMGPYLYAWWCIAVAASHPTVAEITHRREVVKTGRRRLRSSLIVLAVAPALGSLAVPVETPQDGLIRSVVVSLLLILLFARLLVTMSALTRAESESSDRASHDALTGLFNRSGLFEQLADRLDRDAATGVCTAVLFLDCDDFKHVNDTWGHPAGDRLLRAIATGMPDHLRHDDLLARNGGDEFVVVASVPDVATALSVADRVVEFFETPLPVLPGRTHRMTPSIGITVAPPRDTRSPVVLLERADAALYEAKDRGRARYVLYDHDLETRAGYRSAVSDALRSAIAEGLLSICLQPILGGDPYRELVGWEALARWTDPTLGAVPPDVFIPLAEEHGLIDDLGEVILRKACLELARLREGLAMPGAIVSVNVSAAQLTQPQFADVVAEALADAGLPGEALWLEVTESLLVDTTPCVLDTLGRIRDSGVALALDDFGAGTSSFTSLLNLPIMCVKLDRSLTGRLVTDPGTAAQLQALIALLASLKVTHVVAEGVETREHEAALRSVGCPLVQGWLYGRARPVEAILNEAAHMGRAHGTPTGP